MSYTENETWFDLLLRKLRLRRIIKHIPDNSVLVDIGCGHDAKLLQSLKHKLKKGIGIDRKVEATLPDPIEIKNITINNSLPIEDNTADVVTMLAVLEHVDHPQEILNEAYRVLKPNGTMLITTPTPRSRSLLEFLSFKIGLVDPLEILDHKRYVWGFEIYNLLRQAGFKYVRWYEFQLGMNTFVIAKKTEESSQGIREYYKQNQKKLIFICLIIAIMIITLFTRFYNFDERWWVGNDDTREVAIAHIALQRKELPMNGPFSSAGPFMFGAIFYWMVILSVVVIPVFTGPWLFIATCSTATVLILMRIGYLLNGARLSILIGFLAALSPQMIGRSFSLGPHSYISLTTSLLILCFILLWQKKQIKYALFMGLALGIGIAMHYQTINLMLFFPALVFVPFKTIKQRVYALTIMIIGFLIPSLPMIIWDAQQQWANTRNILDYLLIGQKRLYVPNSWSIFLLNFLPYYWSFVVGSWKQLGFILQFLTPIVLIILFLKKKITNPLIILTGMFAVLLIVNRYYRGERSEGYLLYLQPFILLLTSYALIYLLSAHRFIRLAAIVLIACITMGNIQQAKEYIFPNSPTKSYLQTVEYLKKAYPDKKFTVYDYEWKNSQVSQPLSLFLYKDNRIDSNGMPIGFGTDNTVNELPDERTITVMGGVKLIDLSDYPEVKTDKKWVNVNPDSMYDDLMKWSKTEKLQSNFKIF